MEMTEPDGEIEKSEEPDSSRPVLADLFWRDEILQVMYWYQGEGFGTSVTARDLQTFLPTDDRSIDVHLERMVEDGYLERVVTLNEAVPLDDAPPPRYSFTPYGAKEGARRFADEFASITKQAHGDCPPDCPICKDLPPEDCLHCHSLVEERYAT